jgi:hypothetical protein
MVCPRWSITFDLKTRNDYRWLDCCCSFRFTALSVGVDSAESDEEPDEDPEEDEDEVEDDDDEDEEDEAVDSERFLFLRTTHYL